MRKVWLLASTVLAFLNFVKAQEGARTLYSARYDNLDIDTILGSNRLVTNYVDCLLSRKPCPPEGKDLKRILPEALRTKCTRCSTIQKENALKIITRLYYDYPDQYRALRERWDPSGEYHRRFEDYLRGLQFNQIGGNGAGTATTASGGGGNTVESGGNDRPVRNDLDRQPASQSSNVQPVVIDPTQSVGQLPGGNVNTLLATPPTATRATERPRPPAPVAQILFPTTTATTSNISTTTATTTTTTTTIPTTTSTSTSTSGSVELTSITSDVPVLSNTAQSTTTIITLSDGSGAISSTDATPSDIASATTIFTAQLDPAATARPVVSAPFPPGLTPPTMASGVVHSQQPYATTQFGTVAVADEVQLASQQAFAIQLAQHIPPEQQQPWVMGTPEGAIQSAAFPPAPFAVTDQRVQANYTHSTIAAGARPVVGGISTDQNYGDDGNALPQLASTVDVPTTTERIAPRPTSEGGFDEPATAPPLVVVNRFGEDAASARPSFAPVPPPVETTTIPATQRPTTSVRQTRPITRQTTTRNTQRTTTRFITRVPPTAPPTPPRTTTMTTTTTTTTYLPPRPPPPPQPPAQQQPLFPQAPTLFPPQGYPTILYERPQAPPRATAPPPSRPFYVPEYPAAPPEQYAPTPDSIIDHFFVPPSQAANAPLPPSPIVGLWNQLGTKIADTADAIAGMLQKTVDVLVTSHIQAHQRALRRA